MTKSRLVLVCIRLVEKVARVFRSVTEHSKAKPMQSRVTFDTQLKIAPYDQVTTRLLNFG